MVDTTMPAGGQRSSVIPMIIIGVLFFIFGFVTWLNGSLIPFLRIICDLNEFQALFVTFAFYIAYTVMAYPMAKVLEKTGYRNGMALGLAIMVVGVLLFIPAAMTSYYLFFLIGLFVLGTGLTILQTASNPYVVMVGPKESAAMRISIMGLINKGAGVVAPIVFTALVLSDLADPETITTAAEKQALADKLVMPYIYMAVGLTALIGLVKFSNLPHIDPEEEVAEGEDEKSSILAFPQVILGAVGLFAYVGVEVIAGDTIGLFGSNIGVTNFASLTSYTMVCMVIGYVIGVTCIPKFISQQQALLGSAVAGMLCVLGAVLSSTDSTAIADVLIGWAGVPTVPNAVMFVALMGLAHALVWPALWPLALDGLGKFTAQGSALLIMGIAGGAVLPLAFGKLAHSMGDMQAAYWIGLPCYLYILFYALKGHKMRSW
ncbi:MULTISPECIES: sugar MFS transporter [Kordiimonas]|uniref:sugar MFS transporter n=1 Tax=Kordiimonas TaxID=288021 RepID=UPI00257FC930|nr:sugar MFS transporter [Kordiimonas sp. UBA4487]